MYRENDSRGAYFSSKLSRRKANWLSIFVYRAWSCANLHSSSVNGLPVETRVTWARLPATFDSTKLTRAVGCSQILDTFQWGRRFHWIGDNEPALDLPFDLQIKRRVEKLRSQTKIARAFITRTILTVLNEETNIQSWNFTGYFKVTDKIVKGNIPLSITEVL